MSALYGRAQPLGQPVIRTVNRSCSSPSRASSTSSWSSTPGRARSASVTARPQVGKAGQAIDQRRTVEICSTVAIPYVFAASARSRGRQAGSRSASRIDCWQVSRPGVWYFSKNARRPLRQAIVALVLDPAVLDRNAQEQLAVPLRDASPDDRRPR